MPWITWNERALNLLMLQGTEEAIYKTLQQIGEQSDVQVPLDEGTLKSSKFIKAEGTHGFISYGGGQGTGFPRVPYAIRWHENSANFQHGRKSRYLADPFNQHASILFPRNLNIEIKKRLR